MKHVDESPNDMPEQTKLDSRVQFALDFPLVAIKHTWQRINTGFAPRTTWEINGKLGRGRFKFSKRELRVLKRTVRKLAYVFLIKQH